MRIFPAWLALGLAVLGGVGSAVQSAANAELGARVGNPAMGAVVNNAGGVALLLVGLLALPSMRAGLGVLRRARLPWWSYLGGLGGGGFVVIATYVVPALGVAVFTIAQVAGNSAGGLGVDRAGLAPGGRRAVTAPRLLGALLGIGAVALAQFGRPLGELAVGLVALAAAGGVLVALSAALNGRISAVGGAAAGTAVNFAVSTPAIVAVAAVAGAFGRLGSIHWPTDWYLYLGGPVGVGVVVALLVCVRAVGVLRSGLAIVAGQLGGALLLDVLRPDGPGASVAVFAGALLTLLAVVVSGWVVRPAATAGPNGVAG
ncbi:DMT family transporter [Micromonospora sp. NPDC049523]|uniref:DMT family transporter n=1 Tax=Micromonospora sp. NPDC049523 TaxID=3155921 RepID=UPI00343FBD1E